MTTKIDIAIIGGGIMGLSVAHQLSLKHPEASIALFEVENYWAHHTTGRNSGVLHAGLYYPTNSLKHRHCLAGNELWRKFCVDQQIEHHICGKYIVGTKEQEQGLSALYQQAKKNHVDVRMCFDQEIKSLQQEVKADFAFYSPNSGIVNVSEAVQRLAHLAEKNGVMLLKKTEVHKIEHLGDKIQFWAGDDQIESQYFINCAGLMACSLRQQFGLNDFSSYWVKGNYLKTTQKFKFENLIYPVPPADLKGLGVHITFDLQGDFRFGPNTQECDELDYSVDDDLKEQMLPSIQKIFLGVDASKLQRDYCGIRPKIKRGGEIYSDFYFAGPDDHHLAGYYEFLGIESPGLTASLSLAKLIEL